MDLAQRLHDLREDAGLTRTALARPRYTVSYVSQIEAGRRKPSPEAMAYFAGRLGVTSNYLATGIPEDLDASLGYQLEEAREALRESRQEEAEATVRPVIAQAEQYGLVRIRAQAQALLGEALSLGGRYAEAVDAFEAALEEGLSDHEAGVAVGGMARAYRAVGDLAYAADVVEAFLGRSERGALDPTVAADLNSVLLSIYFERGDVLRAERAAKRALNAADQGASPSTRATTYWHASRVLAEAKRWDEALDYATRARFLMEQLEDRRRVARLHNAYAFICLESEPPRTDEAAFHLDRAEVLLSEGSASPGDLAYVYTERARLALLDSRPEDAVAHADMALEALGDDELETARCLFLKGRGLGALGRRAEAGEVLRRASQLFGARGARQQEASCWREIGELALEAGEVQDGVTALRAGLEALDPRRSRA